jgi:hypothetical protein
MNMRLSYGVGLINLDDERVISFENDRFEFERAASVLISGKSPRRLWR